MQRSRVRLTRAVSTLAVAAMLSFGAHAAFAAPATTSCAYNGNGLIGLSCWAASPSAHSWCDYQCKRIYGPESVGECAAFGGAEEGCCLCAI